MSLKKQELKVKPDTTVFVDSKTNARSIALPFRLPDTKSAVLIITRLKDEQWEPSKVIKSIMITYI